MKADPVIAVKMYHDVKFEEFNHKGWQFIFSKSGMFNTTDLDMLSDALILQGIPDITNGNNAGLIFNEKYKIGFLVNTKDALYFCNFKAREEGLIDIKPPGKHNPNHISILPGEVKLKMSDKWKAQDNQDIKILDKISDTFYSSPYKGSVVNAEQIQFWFKKFSDIKELNAKQIYENILNEQNIKNDIDYLKQVFKQWKGHPYSETTQEEIPLHRLTQDNPIIWSQHIELFADELGDNGLSNGEFRFRVMDDCFFGLIRSYLRVDDVIIRILDTRIFHDFKTNYILREFTHREDEWVKIKAKGFDFTPQWSIDPQQSYIIQNNVQIKEIVRDKIFFVN